MFASNNNNNNKLYFVQNTYERNIYNNIRLIIFVTPYCLAVHVCDALPKFFILI